jgi:hypothetical protein
MRAMIRDHPGGETIVDGYGHREYVGNLWHAIGELQLKFLVEQGLRPEHVLYDVGCGSLRGGVKFIPYLNPGNYLGVDINRRLIDAGIQKELDACTRDAMQPEFVVSDRFEFNLFSKQPDLAIAQSLFTHLIESDILLCLGNLRAVAKSNTEFFVSFLESARPSTNPSASDPLKPFFYTRQQMEEFGKSTGWKTSYLGKWDHPRETMMFRYSV